MNFAIVALLLQAFTSGDLFPDSCAQLVGTNLALPGAERVEIVDAAVETADPNQTLELVEHCRVIVETETVSAFDPSDRSTIQSLIRLPKDWNRRLFMGGIGALGGTLSEEYLAGPIALGETSLQRGYITVVNDTGHKGASVVDASWALDVPPSPGIDNQKELNYARYSTHLSVQTAKRVASELYGKGVAFSYFHGCSNGGRQGLLEASVFPEDFDGIIAGAPGGRVSEYFTRWSLTQQAYLPIFGQLTPEKVERVTSLVLAACDADDGVVDGILTDPRRCDFDPLEDLPACPGDVDAADCFTSDQRAFVAFVHSDVALERPAALSRGQLPSSEAGAPFPPSFGRGWASWITGTPAFGGLNIQFFSNAGVRQFLVFDDPDWNEFLYLATTPRSQIRDDSVTLPELDLPEADLTDFARRGGKLLLYHGWIDPALPPEGTIDYLHEISSETRAPRDRFARLFMVPGMAHCDVSGAGAQIFDAVGAITSWVERGEAPRRLEAVSTDGAMIRPLCSYPMEAVYLGGDPNVAESFVCRPRAELDPTGVAAVRRLSSSRSGERARDR